MTAEDVRWEEPPPDGRKLYEHLLPFDKLRTEPFKWARVTREFPGRSAHNVAMRIRKGDYPSILPGDFEAVARKLDDGTYGLWMRYIGAQIDGSQADG